MKTTTKNKRLGPLALMLATFITVLAVGAQAQNRIVRDYGDDGGFVIADPELDVEIWTDNESGAYYEGDEIKLYFRANMDCWVAVYNVDSDGRVNLIYPFDETDDPYVEGGRIYRIPDRYDDYELVVDGPAGTENIQIVASRTPFPVPNWYNGSGLVADRDRYEFIDYVNDYYFGCRSGCPRALDNVSFVVREWDDYYYRPVYYQPWPSYRDYGYVYVDYWWGSSIYIDGYYYGIAPLYLPRIALGPHVVTVYDSYGYCWEGGVTVHDNKTLHLNDQIIRTNAGTVSRYKSVRRAGYRDPVKSGYRDVKITSKVKPRTQRTTLERKTTVTKTSKKTRSSTASTTKGVVKRSEYDSKSRGFGYKRVERSSRLSENKSEGRSSRVESKSGKRKLSPYRDKSSSRANKRLEKRSSKAERSSGSVRSKSKSSRSSSAKIQKRSSSKKSSSKSSGVKSSSSKKKSSGKAVKSTKRSSKQKSSSARKSSRSKKSSSSKARKSGGSKSGSSSKARSSSSRKGSSSSTSSRKSGKSGGSRKSGKSGKKP